jgi:hypothetical protein
MTTVFIDGNLNVPGCNCTPECEMPCWQRVGLTGDGCCDKSHPPCPALLPVEPDTELEET